MSGTPIKKLPASPSVGLSSVPVTDRGSEEVNVSFNDFWAAVLAWPQADFSGSPSIAERTRAAITS
jgi:hypothetical protein